jgi:hypothetical protein
MDKRPSSSGNGDRRDSHDRRRTVSGAIPNIQREEKDKITPLETMRFPWSSPSAPTSPTIPSPGKSASSHKRGVSGSILSRFGIFKGAGSSGERPPSREKRPASRDQEPTSPTKSLFSRKSIDDDVAIAESPTSPVKADREGALSLALKTSKTRKRKGSLRKTALLGGRRNVTEGRERKGSLSLLQRTASIGRVQQPATVGEHDETPKDEVPGQANSVDEPPSRLRRQFSYENAVASSSSDSGWSESAAVSQARLSLLTDHQIQAGTNNSTATSMVNDLGSPLDLKSPVSVASTTSDDDILTFPSHNPPKPIPQPLDSPPTSYFPPVPSTSRRHSHRRSPLSRTLPIQNNTPNLLDPPHDYTETETWGWALLLVTWLTFTVGMGSCLEIWSWAWDVGETPYAPPELEDDPTLPIVGYYPALMVLTGVVAWVWITVAWVGMKYFRHAKIEV